ncbi:MAG TPA: cysteine synthase A [Paludibacter sp.]|nr:cysteine synthase A [Paludibacter sp.]HOS44998.1 cysteine synthase A [Paludibacter sp.]HPM09165.1 cysteine synthase A [Paludibacter sp.]
MPKIAKNLTELIGNTPLVQLSNFAVKQGVKARLIVKLEAYNPASSVKDRIALSMVEDAEAKGLLKPGGKIVEPTSGSTGIGLAMVAAIKGYALIIVMPDTSSVERRCLLKALGAELVLTPGVEGMKGAIAQAEKIVAETGAFMPQQFENEANPKVHAKTTAEEIWRDTDGQVNMLVAGVGTGGTISGTGFKLKKYNPNIQVVAVEPADSPVLSGGAPGLHKIQGIGAGFIPKTYDSKVIDEVFQVTNDQAILTSRQLARQEGILVGISSGAAVYAAVQIALRPENEGKTIVAILPDTGERYLSTELFNC